MADVRKPDLRQNCESNSAQGRLFGDRPDYFAERRNADGSLRFYWKASTRLAPLLLGSLQPWARGVVRLSDDRARAVVECEAITKAVRDYLAQAAAAPDEDEAPLAEGSAPAARVVLRATPGTLAHAIAAYKASARYRETAPATQKQYEWILGIVEDWGGHRRLEGLTLKLVAEAAEKLHGNPRTRQLFLQVLAMVIDRDTLGRALKKGEVVPNPARLLLHDYAAPEPEGGWIWPRLAVDTFAAAAEALGWPSIGTAILLNEWLAQRTGDLLALPRAAHRDGVLHVVQSKTGQYVPLPVAAVAPLRERLAWQAEQEKKLAGNVALWRPTTLLVCETTREAWKLDHFRHEFARVRAAVAGEASAHDQERLAAAGLAPIGGFTLDAVPKRLWSAMAKGLAGLPMARTLDLRFYHLRHTGITRMHQAGCTDEEIMAVSGHTKPAMVYKHYRAVTIERAASAFGRRLAFEGGAR